MTLRDQIVAGNQVFAQCLYKAAEYQQGNFVISPVSIGAAMALVQAGARGNTAEEMSAALGFPSVAGWDAALGGLLAAATTTDAAELLVSNAAFVQRGVSLERDYMLSVERFNGVRWHVDFAADPSDAREFINGLVYQATREKIRDVLPAGSVTTETRLVLTNAVYFLGKWSSEFDVCATRPADFHVSERVNATVQMMSRLGKYAVVERDDAQYIDMPYGDDGSMSMVIVLPREGTGLSYVARDISIGNVFAALDAAPRRRVALSLPRFKVETPFALNDALRGLGMQAVFSRSSADLSGMTGARDLYLSSVHHRAMVSTDEHGSEASAATAAVCTLRSTVAERPITVRADRPFLFIIRDERGLPWFLGRVAGP